MSDILFIDIFSSFVTKNTIVKCFSYRRIGTRRTIKHEVTYAL